MGVWRQIFLVAIRKAWQSVGAFLLMMLLIMLVFALIGEELLAGELVNGFRFHYDSLHWALLTTFQVLTTRL